MARLNVTVDDDVPGILADFAGGERKLGAYISKLVHSVSMGDQEMQPGGDFEMLRLACAAMAGKQREHDGRLLQLERQLAAVIANSQ